MSISLNGYEEKVITLETSPGIVKGDLVKISANNKVAKCAANDVFCGVVLSIKNGYASIKIGGYVKVYFSASSFNSLGYQNLVSDGVSNVKVATTGGRSVLVVDIDAENYKTGIIL